MKLKGKWLPSNDKPADVVRVGDKKEMVNVLSILNPAKTICYEEKCNAGIYDNVDVVIIRIKKILSKYKISQKVRDTLEDIRDNNWQGKT